MSMRDVSNMNINISGVEHLGADLSEQAQELLRHIVDLREQKAELDFKRAQLDVADHAFSEALRVAHEEELAQKQEAG